ncbi:MAG: hypothetical protein KatS3mg076_2327 [Candidatus Binatia bacterium]|nr:MAG: hypothetical protein KatS3mg076_2327 [Candidatus Binatia bacterium]
MFLKTKIRSAAGTPRGVLMVAEERHVASLAPAAVTQFAGSGAGPSGGDLESPHAAAAVNLHVEGVRSTPDVIEIPAEQLAP